MSGFDFEKAKTLDWSNELLDFLQASQLLLVAYQRRDEAKKFNDRRKTFLLRCQSTVDDFTSLSSELRGAFPIDSMATPEETTKSLSKLFFTIVPASLLFAFKSPLSLTADPIFNEALLSFSEFTKKYAKFSNAQLGGTWNPKLTHFPSFSDMSKIGNSFNLFEKLQPCVFYLNRILHLTYKSGLQCWWAPLYICYFDLITLAGKVPEDELPPVSLEGLLGPYFNRSLNNNLKENPISSTISDKDFPEWVLLAMSLKQMREGWGKFNYEDVHQLMEKWGYHHNNNWDPIDFDMLIDRILLLESVETIAEKREIDVSTVKRKTKYLADLLQLTLPRASYKKRSQR